MNIATAEAKNWWHNNLSINKQKTLAKKHLIEGIDYESLVGRYMEYTSAKRNHELVVKVWEAEGRPEGIKAEGYTWKATQE